MTGINDEAVTALARRYEAVLFGTAIGDAMGLTYEGLSPRVIARRFDRLDRYRFLGSRAIVSDDTEQSALVAQSILRSGGDLDRAVRHFRRAMVGWFWRLPWGIGLATLRACLKLTIGLRASGVRSAGNGAAMRSAVIGAVFRSDRATREAWARAFARVTHTDSRAVEGAVFVANVCAFDGDARARIDAARAVLDEPRLATVVDRALALHAQGATVLEAARVLGSTGFIEHTLALAVFAFVAHGDGALDAMLAALYAAGGDTDTIGAIVGGWYGARAGRDAIEPRWIEPLLPGPFGRAHLEALCRALAARTLGDNEVPTVRFWWPLALLRNVALFPVVLAHGFRRLAPPY
jgi:ADP-ribosylglycohydrolase